MNALRHTDWCICLIMAIIMYIIFPLGRWIDHAPFITILFLGFYYLCFAANRLFVIPLFFKGGRWRIVSVLTLICAVWLMFALTFFSEGWPFHQLADFYKEKGKVEMSQQRAWLFFLIVQVVSITLGILSELAVQRISHQKTLLECERVRHLLAIEQKHQQEQSEVHTLQEYQVPQTISIKSERKNMLIRHQEIVYIEAKGNYIYLNLTDGRQLKTMTTLTSILTQLPADQFVRIHRSFVVAHSHIVCFNCRQVIVDGIPLPIGRTYADAIRQL